jgi:ABC-type branched-subunit amino acid transport system ATPase component
MSGENILEIRNIHKAFASTFTGFSGKTEREYAEVLKGITLQLPSGSVSALIGGNGSGKSTLFNIVSGLLSPDKGQVIYNAGGANYDLINQPSYKQAGLGIARLFQGANIFDHLSVLDNLFIADNDRSGEQPWHLFMRPRKVKEVERYRMKVAEHILSRLLGSNSVLWQKRGEPAGSLSIGQQRLLAFARLFMNEKAQLYLLDEPCAGVNEEVRETIAIMIRQLQLERKTVLLIEHNMDFALAVARDGYYLEEGKVVLHDKMNNLIHHPQVMENYLGQHA